MNNTAVTQGDTPAVEAAAVALTAENQPPELPEHKYEFARRMEAEGTAKEAEELRHAERKRFKKQGLGTQASRDFAWAAAMKKYPLADKAVDDEEEAEPEEEEELNEPDSEFMYVGGPVREELAELDRRCRDQPVDLIRDIEFAYANMHRQRGAVRPLDSPSPGAWGQLQVALKIGAEEYTRRIANPILIKAEREKNKKRRENDSEVQYARLQKLREGLGITEPMPDIVYPNK